MALLISSAWAAPQPGPAAAQLSAAAASPSSGRWSDGAPALTSFSMEKDDSVWPPSPLEVGERYEGFEKGFAVAFTAVEWVPNLIARAVPAVGEPLGGLLGLAVMPVGLVAGLVGGLITLLISLF